MNKNLITPEYLRAAFFVREDGVLCHAVKTHGFAGVRNPGDPAGCVNNNGHLVVATCGVRMLAHKVVWVLCYNAYPPTGFDIDHKDRNKQNNHPDNLRLATRSQNNYNATKRKRNTSGYKGVSFDKARGKWDARLNADSKTYRLGRFDTAELAAAAYNEAARQLHGDFARLN